MGLEGEGEIGGSAVHSFFVHTCCGKVLGEKKGFSEIVIFDLFIDTSRPLLDKGSSTE